MNQPGPSVPSGPPMPPSPRQYAANLPGAPPYAMPPPPPPGGLYQNGYPMPPMSPYYGYPPSYPMAGPSNQMMYPIPHPYYPPPQQYMYAPPPQPLPYPPPSPSPRFDSPRPSEYPRQNGGPNHRPRNFSRNHQNYNNQYNGPNYRGPRPGKMMPAHTPMPSSPFPIQSSTASIPPQPIPPHQTPAFAPSNADLAPPPAPDIPQPYPVTSLPPQVLEVLPPTPPDVSVPDIAPTMEAPSSLSPQLPAEETVIAEAPTSPAISLAPTATITSAPEQASTVTEDPATGSVNAQLVPSASSGHAVVNQRPDDPSQAYGLSFSVRSKPHQKVLESAIIVEPLELLSRRRSGKVSKPSRRVPRSGRLIPQPEQPEEDTDEVLEDPLPSSEKPTSEMADVSDSTEPPSLGVESTLTAPLTPSLSSLQSSAPTPASHTPSPSSPVSSATSISAQPSPSVAKAPAATSTAASAEVESASAPAPPAPAARPAPKNWAALFAKPAATPSPAPTSNGPPSAPTGTTEVASMTAVTAADASGGAGPSTAPASSPAGPSRPPAIDTASNVPPLHVILTTAPSAPVPAPLTRPRGLVNTGNMCFANVIMQGLLYTPHFYKLMTVIGRTVPANLGRRALMDATVDFLREFPLESSISPPERPPTSGKSTPLTTDQLRQMSWQQDSFIPQGLYDAMMENKRFEHMRSGRQEDAEEFLGHFLDTLHEEMLAILTRLQANPPPASATWAANAGASALAPAGDDAREVERPLSPSETEGNGWLEVGKKNKVSQTRVTKARESAITSIFGGKLRSTLHTPGTGKDSVTLEPYQHLQLDIKPDYVTSIEEALKHLTEPETVQVHAPNRSGMVDAKKQMLIETLPPILIVHLKRFEYDMRGGVQKSSKPLLYKTTLEIPKEVLAPNQQGVPPPRYRLYGVVYHHGKYTTGGHYTADILRQNQSEWLRIDDTQIGVISESDVSLLSPDKQDADRTAYLLFYQRITDQPGPKSAPAANAQPQVKRPAAAVKGKGRV